MAINVNAFYLCSETLGEVKLNSDRLVHGEKEISRQHSIQGTAEVLLIGFSQTYFEN